MTVKLRRRTRPLLRWLLWLLPLPLVAWAFRQVSLPAVWQALRQLTMPGIAVWLLGNGVVLATMTMRWWLILRAQGIHIPFWQALRYRQASFGVSFFTPGPMFGGEPLQVLALSRRHGVSHDDAVASVGLDRMLELVINFAFLMGAAWVLLPVQLPAWTTLSYWFALPLALPAIYLGALAAGFRPLAAVFRPLVRYHDIISSSEQQMGHLLRNGRTLWQLVIVSVLGYMALLAEFTITLLILGLTPNITQVLLLFATVRLSLLAPTPGGLGAVEAGQVLGFAFLGFDIAIAGSVMVLIRLRDLTLGLLGLHIAGTIWYGSYKDDGPAQTKRTKPG